MKWCDSINNMNINIGKTKHISFTKRLSTNKEKIEATQKCFRHICSKLKLPYFEYDYGHWCTVFNVEPLYLIRATRDRQFIVDLLINRVECKHILKDLFIRIPLHNTRTHNLIATMSNWGGGLKQLVSQ